MSHSNEYYVYVLKYGKDVLYIGYGCGDRVNHVLSGVSHNKALNTFVALGYDPSKLTIIKLMEDIGRDLAQIVEYRLLQVINPLFNINVSNSTPLKVAEYLYEHKKERSRGFKGMTVGEYLNLNR